MKLLIHIDHDNELMIYESLALALALASFDHQIQIAFTQKSSLWLLQHPHGKIGKMLTSLALYDIPPAWLDQQVWQQYQNILAQDDCQYFQQQVIETPKHLDLTFDNILNI